ncbi:hypothetical protein BLA60_32900 [Actinophytocola xinjiangensis]|uniref:YCII-related domain-containing protein n=1 Tax=Actinophytocola xinjiangensis TaxID=485602 RepID=A0A7Z1AUY2_9PSEU|nr:YciI family protein [Actinophytocola xinjiangensis]OLF06140.1 hypothetical protein BLA60_32900 [Actinophytocola xinjiangensis]
MRYLMLAYTNAQAWEDAVTNWDPNAPMPADVQEACEFYEVLGKELTESGEFVTTEGLEQPSHTKTIRKRPDGPEVTDGPYAELKEVLASYAIIDCQSYDRAVEIGARIADATGDTIEIRPTSAGFGS